MNAPERFAHLGQAFFIDHLVSQRDLSPRTIGAYRDTFRLLLNFFHEVHGKRPDQLTLSDLSATHLVAFLQHLEESRGNCVRTRNLRLAALRSFIRYVGACEGRDMIAHTQRIMAIPIKRFVRPTLGFLSTDEMQAILQAIGNSWTGRRDHLLFLFLYNTGARVSEATCVCVRDVQRYDYRSVEFLGKGRKQRTVPLWKETTHHIRAWLKLSVSNPISLCCPIASALHSPEPQFNKDFAYTCGLPRITVPLCATVAYRLTPSDTPRLCICSSRVSLLPSSRSGWAMKIRRPPIST